MKESKKKIECWFVVMGIQHFMNGEHHWIAPERDDAEAFAEEGKYGVNENGKPMFTSLKDAENFAMSIAHDEYTLAHWEERRPTMYVLENWAFLDVVRVDKYSYPEGSENWDDAKTADYERECNCNDIANLAVWDSDTDEDRYSEVTIKVATELGAVERLSAWLAEYDQIGVESIKMGVDEVIDLVEAVRAEGALSCESIEFSHSDGDAAYFDVH